MKLPLIIVAVLFSFVRSYSNDCFCEKDSLLSQIIDCSPIIFDNNAKLYWSFNCDSSWLTFENAENRKTVIFSLDSEIMILTGRIGYSSFQEYSTTFLVESRLISGCCYPSEYYLYDKSSGAMIEFLGKAIYTSDNINTPIFIYLSKNYDSLIIYNIETKVRKRKAIHIQGLKERKENIDSSPIELYFEAEAIGNDTISIKCMSVKNNRFYKIITINLKDYIK